MKQFSIMTTALLYTIFILACSSQMQLNSQRPDAEIVADGEITEWQNNLTYIEEKNVSVGFYNDEDNLYISFKTNDRSIIRQAMGMGLTVWLDAGGGKGKDFGIRFPIGRMSGGIMGDDRPRQRGERQGQPDFEEMSKRFEEQLTIYELIAPGEDEPRLFNRDELAGLRLDIKMNPDEGMVYELQIPLNSSDQNPYAIEIEDSQNIGVGFETAKMDFEQMPDQSRMGGGMGGRTPGGRGSMSGGRGGMGGSGMGRTSMSDQFKLWTKVNLSLPDLAK